MDICITTEVGVAETIETADVNRDPKLQTLLREPPESELLDIKLRLKKVTLARCWQAWAPSRFTRSAVGFGFGEPHTYIRGASRRVKKFDFIRTVRERQWMEGMEERR